MTSLHRDYRNVAVLATCQMLFGTARSLVVATAPLIAYSLAAVSALAAGPLLHFFSWNAVNYVALPMIALALSVTLHFAWVKRRAVATQGE